MKKDDLVFVYGTLRKGQSADITRRMNVAFIGEDRIAGEMYNLGWYPGVNNVTLVEDGGFISEGPTVIGEVYQIQDDSQVRQLDMYEGHPDLFVRVQVSTEKGLTAWVYIFPWDVSTSELIPGGDWVRRGLGINEIVERMEVRAPTV